MSAAAESPPRLRRDLPTSGEVGMGSAMSADRIRVAVAGYRGKVGSVLASAFQAEPGIEYVGGIELGDDLAEFLREKRPRAFVDFTQPSEALHNALAAVAAGGSPRGGATRFKRGAEGKL